jgi:uncharacterized SAM-binding protein YcdF (DUF218 family)
VDVATVRAIESIVLPPGGLILLAVVGLAAWRWRLGRLTIFLALLGLYAMSTPQVAGLLAAGLQTDPPVAPQQVKAAGAQAVVVALAGRLRPATEYGADETLAPLSMQRLRYGAWLSRRTGLPLVVTGGAIDPGGTPLATLAAEILADEYGLRPLVTEADSDTTWENAHFTARLLDREGIRSIALVTNAFHMPRTRYSFEHAGLEVLAAPTGFYGDDEGPPELSDWLPSANAMLTSSYALHEYIGQVWYLLYPPAR